MTLLPTALFAGNLLDAGGQVFNVRHPDYGAVGDAVADASNDLLSDGRFVYAYADIEEYLKIGSWTDISEAFRVGWKMARLTQKDLQEIAENQFKPID